MERTGATLLSLGPPAVLALAQARLPPARLPLLTGFSPSASRVSEVISSAAPAAGIAPSSLPSSPMGHPNSSESPMDGREARQKRYGRMGWRAQPPPWRRREKWLGRGGERESAKARQT
eukprot:scaffold66729_cov33-Tisochrysis_lutea.AAC.8